MIRRCTIIALFLISAGVSTTAQSSVGDVEAKLISGPTFEISAEDEAAGIDGTMKVGMNVDKSGKVTKAFVYVGPSWPCSGDLWKRVRAVMQSAENAVLGYKFLPKLVNGEPVETSLGISLTIGRSARKEESEKAADPNAVRLPKLIRGGVVNGKAVYLAQPVYPAEAKVAGVSGKVSVQILIDEEGRVISAQAVEGPVQIQFAARSAACSSRFSPTKLAGMPVKVSGIVDYNFSL